jgi:enterochelin esterase-like enzyme
VSRALPIAAAAVTGRSTAVKPPPMRKLLAAQIVPIVEGTRATFIWRGQADAVGVDHRVMGLPHPLALRRAPGTDVWWATIELPRGARVEYRLVIRRGGHVENILDPLNPRVATGPMSEASVLLASGYVSPAWAEPDPSAPAGRRVDLHIKSRALRRQALVTLYFPARLREAARYPLLIVHDGGDYLNYVGMTTVLDNLMHQRLMADAVVAFTYPKDRIREYAASSGHSRFLTTELVPELERTLPLRGDAASRVLAGASFGGVASLAAAARAPGFYGGLLLESPSLRFSANGENHGGGHVFTPVVRFVNSLRAQPQVVTHRLFQTYGAFEPLSEPNRAMTRVLRQLADEMRVVEALDGHNWTAWRDRLFDGLTWLLPGDAA